MLLRNGRCVPIDFSVFKPESINFGTHKEQGIACEYYSFRGDVCLALTNLKRISISTERLRFLDGTIIDSTS